jgi:hypothetical protein
MRKPALSPRIAPASTAPTDKETDVVADRGRDNRRDDDPKQRQMAEARERGAGQQDGLAGHWHAGVFEHDAEKDDEVAVAREQISQPDGHVV